MCAEIWYDCSTAPLSTVSHRMLSVSMSVSGCSRLARSRRVPATVRVRYRAVVGRQATMDVMRASYHLAPTNLECALPIMHHDLLVQAPLMYQPRVMVKVAHGHEFKSPTPKSKSKATQPHPPTSTRTHTIAPAACAASRVLGVRWGAQAEGQDAPPAGRDRVGRRCQDVVIMKHYNQCVTRQDVHYLLAAGDATIRIVIDG